MADVFISYHRSDGASALVRRIVEELESRGVSCWYDMRNTPLIYFVERIVKEINRCKVFLFLWDEKANEERNSNVRHEIQWAYGNKHSALFPFQVGHFEKSEILRFYFAHINILYGGDSFETAQIGELVNAIADVLGKTQPLPPVVPQPQQPHFTAPVELDVFISYHEESAGELAEQIANELETAGISCWCARRDLPFGGDFARVIPSKIEACKVFLLILNDSAVHQSNHMENELGLAFGRYNHRENIVILPIEFGDFKREEWIKYYLVHTQSIKFPKKPGKQHIQEIVKQIAKRLKLQTP